MHLQKCPFRFVESKKKNLLKQQKAQHFSKKICVFQLLVTMVYIRDGWSGWKSIQYKICLYGCINVSACICAYLCICLFVFVCVYVCVCVCMSVSSMCRFCMYVLSFMYLCANTHFDGRKNFHLIFQSNFPYAKLLLYMNFL